MTPAEFREARQTLGLNQSQMAAMLGYNASSRISEVEAGRRPLPVEKLWLMQAYLGGWRHEEWPL